MVGPWSRRQTGLAIVLMVVLAAPMLPMAERRAQAQPSPVSVSIVDFAFEPGSIEVPVGTEVTFTNDGEAPHTVTSNTGAFDSGRLDPGGSFSFTFTEAGSFGYFCAFHPNMQATIVVVEEAAQPVETQAPVEPTAAPAETAGPDDDGDQAPDGATGDAGIPPIEVPYLAHIHAGTCEELGIVVFALADFRSYALPETGGAAVQMLIGTARVEVPELFSEPFSIHIHKSEVDKQVYIACAEIGQQPADPWQPSDGLALPLNEQQDSGERGVAQLRPDTGGATTVTLVLAADAAVQPEATADTSASRPTTYTSPTFGYTLSYGQQWTVEDEASDGRQDRLNLANGTSVIRIVGAEGFSGEPEQCVTGFAEELLVDPAVDNVTLATDDQGNPLQGGTEATGAFAVYNHTYAFNNGNVVPYTLFIGCIPLIEGEAVLSVIQNVPTADYNDQVAAREGLLRGLTLPQLEE